MSNDGKPVFPPLDPRPGVPRAGCNYLMTCGQPCNKCGHVHWCAPPAEAQEIDHLDWAIQCWNEQVALRPMVNVHRRTLDDTWRQVIRHFGGDPDALIGPSHDDLRALAGTKEGEK